MFEPGQIGRARCRVVVADRRQLRQADQHAPSVIDDPVEFARREFGEPQRVLADFGLARFAQFDLVVGLDQERRQDRQQDEAEQPGQQAGARRGGPLAPITGTVDDRLLLDNGRMVHPAPLVIPAPGAPYD